MNFSVQSYSIKNKSYFYVAFITLNEYKNLNKKFELVDFVVSIPEKCDESIDFETREEAENHLRKYIRLKKLEKIS